MRTVTVTRAQRPGAPRADRVRRLRRTRTVRCDPRRVRTRAAARRRTLAPDAFAGRLKTAISAVHEAAPDAGHATETGMTPACCARARTTLEPATGPVR